MDKIYIILAIGVAFVAISAFMLSQDLPKYSEVHWHADFKLYLNGQAYDFNQSRFMSVENSSLSAYMHFHDMDGEVIHQHITGFNLGDFFSSLGANFTSTCFSIDEESYCNNGQSSLKMYVNGIRNFELEKYEFRDLDRILITFGSEDESSIKTQIDSVTNEACIQSGKCPDRGSPSNESSCTTQGGCAS